MRRTFREDYEFYGAEEGIVHGDYRGACSECGLSVSFTYEHPFYTRAQAVDTRHDPC